MGHLTRNVGKEHVHEIFSFYGSVRSVDVAIDKQVNLPRGFAYVEFNNTDDADNARMHLDGGQIDGNVIR